MLHAYENPLKTKQKVSTPHLQTRAGLWDYSLALARAFRIGLHLSKVVLGEGGGSGIGYPSSNFLHNSFFKNHHKNTSTVESTFPLLVLLLFLFEQFVDLPLGHAGVLGDDAVLVEAR